MRLFTISLLFSLVALTIGCGDDGGGTTIDAPKTIDAAVDAPAAALSCANYCTSITANCTGTNQMYSSMATCLSSCALYPMGTAADMAGNTLGCRTYHAGAASTAPAVHCRHAGPGGDGMCGTNCEGFCAIVQGACSTQATPPYADLAACTAACPNFATTPVYDQSVQTGNSLACRLYHATVATGTPIPHCNHTKVAGGGGANFPCQ